MLGAEHQEPRAGIEIAGIAPPAGLAMSAEGLGAGGFQGHDPILPLPPREASPKRVELVLSS